MTPSTLARQHFEAAAAEAVRLGLDPDALGRQMLGQIIQSFLTRRSISDVRAELTAALETIDPDTDFMFMRP